MKIGKIIAPPPLRKSINFQTEGGGNYLANSGIWWILKITYFPTKNIFVKCWPNKKIFYFWDIISSENPQKNLQ